ncbi:MAG: domain containing protein [Myxococcales bacterium]|nr:domain containing protein [Myxococcales bacterium]
MRKTLHAFAAAFAILLAAAAPAHAADKLRLERMDLKASPTLKLYMTMSDSDGRAITGRAKEDFRIVVDSAEQGAAAALQTFDESKEPINLVIVAENGPPMQSVLEDVKRAIAALADSLPPKSKVALISYATDFKRLAELGGAVDAESAAKTMTIDSEGTELRMLQAVRSAIDILGAVPKGERKLIVVFSDGLDVDMELRTFSAVSKRAADAGIVIDTIGYTEFDASKLRTLTALSKQALGIDRVCKTASDISNHFNNVIDEIKKQYIATFEVPLAGGDNKAHQFQVIVGGTGGDKYSNIVEDKLPKASHPVAKKGESSRWWLWMVLGLLAVGIIGLIAWAIFREKPEQMPEEEEAAPAPAAAPAPQGPMKTMALNVSAMGGAPAVGWIVATNGKHADQTFKLKPARTLIGTGTDCDVKVDDQFMSSHHCEVRFEGSSFKLFDLGSTNGIVVNDKKVREHELIDNDLFRLGRTEFKFKSIT